MPFNRIGSFYVGRFTDLELNIMTLDDQNDELNEALDTRLSQLSAAIAAHEKALKAMKIPRDVIYCYLSEQIIDHNGNATGQFDAYYVAMIKWQGTWRLCHAEHYSCDYSSTFDWKPLVDCSIPDRLRAAPHLDKLRKRIVEEKMKVIPELEAAIEGLATSLESFEDKPR
ncbi:MAG: hypothetical protein ACYC35_28135 [Pirellulales bacterium]